VPKGRRTVFRPAEATAPYAGLAAILRQVDSPRGGGKGVVTMGRRTERQEALFYGFILEEHVPADHLLRSIDRFVELTEVRRHLEPYYSASGRPSVDPELMFRMPLPATAAASGPTGGSARRST
jgi:hypothetical protein